MEKHSDLTQVDYDGIKVDIHAEGSGQDLIRKFEQDRLNAMAPDAREYHRAAVISVMAAVGRLGSLEIERLQAIILKPEQEAEYRRLLAWWNHIGEDGQKAVALKAAELSNGVYDLWRYFR